MKYLTLLLVIPILQVQSCDLTKHYINEGEECCKKCGPGTRMASISACGDPTCTPCSEGEYQPGYTKELTCSRQPYCDLNLHFESTKPVTKEHISECRCIEDYHCISEHQCSTCVLNTPCPPGQKVSENATRKTDTKCVECPHGTFSSQTSFEGNCQPWTKCNIVKQEGTTKTDRLCEDAETSHHIGVALALALAAGVFVLLICSIYCWKTGKFEILPRTQGDCADIWKKKFQKENKHHIEDIEAGMQELLHRPVAEENEVKDEETMRAPVQEGDSRSESHIDTEVRSEGGQPVQQEEGKVEILSQTESCQST